MLVDGVALAAGLLLVIAVVAAATAAKGLARRESVVVRRLKASAASGEPVASPGLAELLVQSLGPLAKAAQPLREEELSRLRLQLARAGYRGDRAMQVFLASKVALAIAFALAFLWLNSSRARPLEPGILLAISSFALGYYIPSLWLASRVKARQLAVERGLPDSLDLLVTCVEAGLGLDAALQRVASETKLAWPTLGEELELTFLEIKAGIARVEAFRRLAHRTGVAELKSLAATLTQTETFGTSVGLALRVQAEGIRTRRMQRAEERAGYVSVKMALPLTFCILPTLFAAVIGPAIIRVAQTLLPVMRGR